VFCLFLSAISFVLVPPVRSSSVNTRLPVAESDAVFPRAQNSALVTGV